MKDTVFARRSIRRFKQIPVTKEQIQALLDSALVAPSARNGQLLRYCVVSSPEKLKEVFNNDKIGHTSIRGSSATVLGFLVLFRYQL
jgi:nitroreductase